MTSNGKQNTQEAAPAIAPADSFLRRDVWAESF